MVEAERIKAALLTIGAVLLSLILSLELLVLSLLPKSLRRKDVSGKVVLMTGGGSGIGRLVSQKLASKGAKIVTWDVNQKGNDETAKIIKKAGGKCFAYTVDLCDRTAIYEAAKRVKREVGKVDILVNNAGIVTGNSFLDCPDESIIRTFDVNIMCHFWTLKAFLPDMIKANSGHVVTIASLAGIFGNAKLIDYSASKFAAVGLDESLRTELNAQGHTGIKTTVVCPFYINTGMFEGVKSSLLRILEQEEVAEEITDAILMGKQQLVLPKMANVLVASRGIITCRAGILIQKAMGTSKAMDEFTGRKKQR